jgi:sugar-phosphatase
VCGVLFDLDGVLVDSAPCLRRAWYEWAGGAGVDARATFALGQGRTTLDHIRLAAPELATPDQVSTLDALEQRYVDTVVAMPGARAALSALRTGRWGVVTSCRRAVAVARIRAARLPLPAVLVTADDVVRPKPAADGYRTGCTRLALPPELVVVFEDAPAGIAAARAAGCRTVALTGGRHGTGSPADARIPDLGHARFTVSATRVDIGLARRRDRADMPRAAG